MAQNALTSLVATVNNGTQFLSEHEALKANLLSDNSGASRPSYAVAGTQWTKIVSATVWELYYFDGTDDILTGTINPSTNAFTPAGVSSVFPPGSVIDFADSAAPAGWLLCFGRAVSRATYSAPFTVISTAFGVGDGSTTFNVPDKRGRVSAGPDNMGGVAAGRLTNTVMSPNGNTLGAVGGAQTHSLSVAEMPAHNHTDFRTVADAAGNIANGTNRSGESQNTGSAGSGAAHNNTQPTLLLNSIIET